MWMVWMMRMVRCGGRRRLIQGVRVVRVVRGVMVMVCGVRVRGVGKGGAEWRLRGRRVRC